MTLTRSAQNGPGAALFIIRRTVGCVQRRAPARAEFIRKKVGYQISAYEERSGHFRDGDTSGQFDSQFASPPVQCAAEQQRRAIFEETREAEVESFNMPS